MNLKYCFGKLAATAGVFVAALASAHSQTVWVYDGQLENGWANWSWCTTDFANTQYTLGGLPTIKATITSGYQGLFFAVPLPVAESYFSTIQFYINGGAAAGRSLSFAAYVNGAAKPSVNLNNYISGGGVAANAWRPVTVPISALGLAPTDQIEGFWLQDTTGSSQPAFWVASLSLDGLTPSQPISVTVNAGTQVEGNIQSNMFGVNTAVWDSGFNSTTLDSEVAAAKYQAFRFPGGSLSDTYNWQTNQTNDGTTWPTSFDTFASVAGPLGIGGMLTTNYGTGTAAEAAAWVKYSNVTKGYGFKYWELGNEVYGTWETDSHAVPNDPYTYAQQFAAYSKAMKAVDPTIKVGAVIAAGEDSYVNNTNHPAKNPVTGAVHNGWTPVMLTTLAQLGVVPDFVIYHRYPIWQGQECDFTALTINPSFTSDIQNIRTQITDYYSSSSYVAGAAGIQILCTENNSNAGVEGKQMVSLVNGLFLADSFGTAINTECKGYFWWDLINGPTTAGNNGSWLYGWREYGDEGQVDPNTFSPYPTYYIEKLISKFAEPGDAPVNASTANPILTAYATKRADGSVRLLLINKHPTLTISAKVVLNGVTPTSTATIWQYGMAEDDAAKAGQGSADIRSGVLSNVAPTSYVSVPPYSATVVIFTPAG
jgi:alpha-L-arabinofuranosidase